MIQRTEFGLDILAYQSSLTGVSDGCEIHSGILESWTKASLRMPKSVGDDTEVKVLQ